MVIYYILLINALLGLILNAQIHFTEGGRVPDMVMYALLGLLALFAVICDYEERKERKSNKGSRQ